MTKRHFDAIADILRDRQQQARKMGEPIYQLIDIERDLSEYFQTINPRFDPEQFARACAGE